MPKMEFKNEHFNMTLPHMLLLSLMLGNRNAKCHRENKVWLNLLVQ